MSDESSTYTRGDRVKVTIEGEVDSVWSDIMTIKAKTGRVHNVVLGSENLTLEKLPDPEPKWKVGSVVKWGTLVPLVRGGTHWAGLTGETPLWDGQVSEAWKAGTLEVLYTP